MNSCHIERVIYVGIIVAVPFGDYPLFTPVMRPLPVTAVRHKRGYADNVSMRKGSRKPVTITNVLENSYA